MTDDHDHARAAMPISNGLPRSRLRAAFVALLVAVLLITGTALVVGGEALMRYRERHRAHPPDFLPTIYYPHARTRIGLVPGLEYYGWLRINSSGFRGEDVPFTKPAGTFRILCLGGSTTFDISNLAEEDSWPQVMLRHLSSRAPQARIEVLNLGVPGTTALDSLIDFHIRGILFEPDIVIVYQGHNDFRYTIYPPRVPTAPSELHPYEQAPRSSMARWVQMNSLLYSKVMGRLSAITGGIRITSWLGLGRFLDVSEAERAERIRDGIAEFHRNVGSIAAIARANGVELVLPAVIHPEPASPGDATCGVCANMVPAYRGLPAAAIASGYSAYRAVIERAAAEYDGVTFVPTEGWVPSEDAYYADPVHFSRQGSAIMGSRMADAILPLVSAKLSPLTPQGEAIPRR